MQINCEKCGDSAEVEGFRRDGKDVFAGPKGWSYLQSEVYPPTGVTLSTGKSIEVVLFVCSDKCRDGLFSAVDKPSKKAPSTEVPEGRGLGGGTQ